MRRSKTLVTTVIAAAVLGSGLLSAPAAADPLEIATQDDGVMLYRKYLDAGAGFGRMQQLKVDYLRVNVNWVFSLKPGDQQKTTPPAAPQWDFAFTDRIVADSLARGIKLQFTLTGPAPAWATEDRRVGTRNPSSGQFARFARAFAQRYRGRVFRYAVWNEPNQPGWWSPQTRCTTRAGRGFVTVRGKRRRRQVRTCRNLTPRLYRTMYFSARNAIKSVDPRNQVFFGELAPIGRRYRTDSGIAPRTFLREALCVDRLYRRKIPSCKTVQTDGVAHHPYPLAPTRQMPPSWRGITDQDITLASYDRLRGDLEAYQRLGAMTSDEGGVPGVFYTEMGFQTGGPRAISEALQARYVRESIGIAARQPGVKQYLFYTLYDEAPGRKWIAGLFRYDGAIKPSFRSALAAIRAGEHGR